MNDTLAFHKQRPLTRQLDLADVPLMDVANQIPEIKKTLLDREGVSKAKPEVEALWFYMMNHAMAEIGLLVDEDEPLGDFLPIVEGYHTSIQLKSLRMFFYLLLITARESRHCSHTSKLSSLYSKYDDCRKLHQKIAEGSFSEDKFREWAKSRGGPDLKLGRWLEFTEKQFTQGGYGSSYGGKPWANIARVAKEFVQGKITAEMMMDTGFTLEHNTCSMFNKGMLYSGYSSDLMKILDVQRSGQVPQLINDMGVSQIEPEHTMWCNEVKLLLPAFRGYVDWYMVEKLGAVGSYHSEKKKQDQQHGSTNAPKVADKVKEWKKKAAAFKKQKEDALFKKQHIEVTSGVFVKKAPRSLAS